MGGALYLWLIQVRGGLGLEQVQVRGDGAVTDADGGRIGWVTEMRGLY